MLILYGFLTLSIFKNDVRWTDVQSDIKFLVLFVFTVIDVGVLNTKFKYHFGLSELNETTSR